MLMPLVSNYSKAQQLAGIMVHILAEEMKLQTPQRFQLVEHGQFTWLFAVMDDLNLGSSMQKYISGATLHRLSTALDGLPVKLSNHSGLRYAVMLSDPPRLPQRVDFPEGPIAHDAIPLGMGLTGPVHVNAKQLINAIVVGSQDSGKSMVMRALAHSARLHGSKLYLADAVEHTFRPALWNRVSSLPVARNTNDMLKLLERINWEITQRVLAFEKSVRGTDRVPPEDLDAYNALTGESMPRVWLIADEVNSFLASKAVQERLGDPARIGRKYGVHLVLAGHDWHEYTVKRELTSYFETRLCLRTANDTAGKIVLDDHVRGKKTMRFSQPGRAILKLRGQYRDVQLYFLAPEREEQWFAQIRPAHHPEQMMLEEAEIEKTPARDDEIAQMAERIRAQWQPGMSKNQVAKLLTENKKGYAGPSWMIKVDRVIAYLGSSSSTEEGPNDTPGAQNAPLAA